MIVCTDTGVIARDTKIAVSGVLIAPRTTVEFTTAQTHSVINARLLWARCTCRIVRSNVGTDLCPDKFP